MSQIINGKRSITGDTALRLGHWFNIEPQFWMNLQAQFDLVSADRNAGDEIKALPTAGANVQNKNTESRAGHTIHLDPKF
ncbi:MAG: HigA family addiction module antidote protein [Nitrosomonas sp.]|nr:HigA family addiction module antidote protein [Nitrosomonas sp.]